MAEATQAGVRGPSAQSLLATKLHAPRVKRGFVARPRLIDQLNDGVDRRMTLVCAPPGFGKTALLAEWSSQREGPVAWLSLDPADNDPARFWRHLAAAIDRAVPGIADRIEPVPGSSAPSLDGQMTALINELNANPTDLAIVLDDYHAIDVERIHASVQFLVEHAPEDVHVVVTSRADPPLALARLRVGGQLDELRAVDLRFTRSEAADLFAGTVGPEFPDAATRALTDRTEGWVAGLQLAALSLRERADVEAFVTTFSGSHRYVLDYLTEEVLDRQPEDIRRFLIETSLLARLSGDLCDAVTGRTDGQAMLEEVERANLFVIALDDVRGWWRYHHLFADLLRARLEASDPDRVVAIHRAAADWHAANDLPDEAVHHAIAAGDMVWAARLIERHADARFHLNEAATFERWLGQLPREVVEARPRLLLAQANLALVSGDEEGFEVPFEAARRAIEASPAALDEPFEPSIGPGPSLLLNLPAAMALGASHLAELRGDPEATTRFAAEADALAQDGEWRLEILIRAHRSVAALLRGDLAEADEGFTATLARCREVDERIVAARTGELLGMVQRAEGRLGAALETYRQALEIIAPPGLPPPPGAGGVHVAIAEVAYQRGDLEAAIRHLDVGLPLCRQVARTISASPQPLATGLATLAWVRHAAHDPVGAREAMAEATEVAPGPGVISLLNPVTAQHAQLALADGDLDTAIDWAAEQDIDPDDTSSYAREPEYLVLARLLIARDRPAAAAGLLERLATDAAADHRDGSLIEIEALRALALEADGMKAEALATLADALARAEGEGWIRVFVDEGPPMAALLGRLVATPAGSGVTCSDARQMAAGRAATLLRRFDASAVPDTSHDRQRGITVPGLVETLSEREFEVLQLVAAGHPNREIASELFVTVDTVKKHVTHLLGKLGVTNRTQAAALARSLGLIPEHGDESAGRLPPFNGTSE
jgi:LuxR family maltose regulon positive regulatory protein